MKFLGFISIKTSLPRNKSRFYYKITLHIFRKLFQMGFKLTAHPRYVGVFQIAFLLPHAMMLTLLLCVLLSVSMHI